MTTNRDRISRESVESITNSSWSRDRNLGRPELAQLLTALSPQAKQQRQTFYVYGPRGVGKSWLLHALKDELEQQPENLCILLPMRMNQGLPRQDFSFLCEKISLSVEEKLGFRVLAPNFTPKKGPAHNIVLEQFFKQVVRQVGDRGKKLIIALDDLDTIIDPPEYRVSGSLFGLLRYWSEYPQAELKQLRLIVSSCDHLSRLVSAKMSPITRSDLIIPLERFTREQFLELAKRHQVEVEQSALPLIDKFIEFDPSLSTLLLYAAARGQVRLSEATLKQVELWESGFENFIINVKASLQKKAYVHPDRSRESRRVVDLIKRVLASPQLALSDEESGLLRREGLSRLDKTATLLTLYQNYLGD